MVFNLFSRITLLACLASHGVAVQFTYLSNQLGSDIDGESAFDSSGSSVSISGDGKIVAVGAYKNSPSFPDMYQAGHVRVKEYNSTTDTWVQLGQDIDGEFSFDESGYSVALSMDGKRVVIGAWKNSLDPVTYTTSEQGHGRVYEYNGTMWNQMGSDIDGEADEDFSGNSVAMNAAGNIVAISAFNNDISESVTDAGHVRILQWSGTAWNMLGDDIIGEEAEDFSGTSVALSESGLIVAIGAPGNNGNGEDSGHVRVFEWNSSQWVQLGDDIDGLNAYDSSGISVSLSGNGLMVAIGSPQYDGVQGTNTGLARVMEYDSKLGWVQRGAGIEGESDNDESGVSVSLSSDGTVLAVGAWYNDGNGTRSGHVRVHKWNTTAWNQIVEDIDGEAGNDESGRAVSIDNEGNTLAVAAWMNTNSNGENSGHVRVFELQENNNPGGGFNGDPIILGLRDQVFKFEGRDGGWYSNLSIKNLHWNMQFRKFDTCPEDANMFVSGIALSLCDDHAKGLDSKILIVTTPNPISSCQDDPNNVCLGAGTLHISFDGGETFTSQPGDFHFGSQNRVVAHNTYAACSRKWHDYDVSQASGIKLRNVSRRLMSIEKKPMELLLKNRAEMIDKSECADWITDRKKNNDLFQQSGHWSTIYIETPIVKFHVEYRRSDFFNAECEYQSLDGWMTKVSAELEQTEWNGILGETRRKIFDTTTGEQIKTDRSRLLRGKEDADYEVRGPFKTTFAALKMDKPIGGTEVASSIVNSLDSSIVMNFD